MHAVALEVPRLAATADGAFVVTRWGRVGGVLLRPGDRLIPGLEEPAGMLLLVSRGWGHPMVARRSGRTLVAEPGGVPVLEPRWSVAGGLEAVERELGRGVPGPGPWCVAVRVEGGACAERFLADAGLERSDEGEAATFELAGGEREGGRSPPLAWMDAERLDVLCIRAATARDTLCEVAVAAARDPETARALLATCRAGFLRFSCSELASARRGPLDGAPTGTASPPAGRAIPFPADPSDRRVPARVAGPVPRGGGTVFQLSLFASRS